LGHITTNKTTVKEVKKSILIFLSTKYETKDLIAIGCDGTVVNTGYKTGVIRLI
jgi:small-conductance mechanosensitive channel